MDEYFASLALRYTRGLGPRTWKRLLDHYGSAAQAVQHSTGWSEKKLVSSKVHSEFLSRAWQELAEVEHGAADTLGLNRVLYHQPEYPELLRHIPDPPLFLYTIGDLSLLSRPCVAVVGSRQASRYGQGMAESIAAQLSKAGICVVSGFAHGIDRAAHQGALREIGSTIAVLGTGPDLIYPATNKDLWRQISAQGLIVSEFAPGTKPEGNNFPHRNRIVSGLALGVLVVEGALASGSLITARLALAQGREVFALPGPANLKTYQGCHQLIREGAGLVQEAADILQELEPVLGRIVSGAKVESVPQKEPTDQDQLVIFRYLHTQGPTQIDALTRHVHWPADKVSAILLLMEVQGWVVQHPGMVYSLGT